MARKALKIEVVYEDQDNQIYLHPKDPADKQALDKLFPKNIFADPRGYVVRKNELDSYGKNTGNEYLVVNGYGAKGVQAYQLRKKRRLENQNKGEKK